MTAARTIAVRDQVLAALRDQSSFPISTKEVCERIGVHRYDNVGLVVYRVLAQLRARGDVEQVRIEGSFEVFWRTPLIHTDTELPEDEEPA